MSKIKFYKDSAKTQQVYPELDPEDITKFESLEDIENAFPNVSGEDTNLTLNHTVEAPMRLELAPSELEQATTTGKNLLDLKDGTYYQNGITAIVSNGVITLNGTATANSFVTIPLNTNLSLVSGQYTISTNNEIANSNVRFRIESQGTLDTLLNAINKTNTITYNNETLYGNQIVIRVQSGDTLSNFKFKPMLEKGSTAHEYEPYTGGQPSPSPEFPMDIHTISGDNEIKVVNKNFAYLKDGTYTKENDTAIINNNLITLNTSSSTGINSYFSFGNGYTQTWAPAGDGIKNVNDLKLTGDGGNYIATIYTNKTISGSISFRIYTSNNRELMTNIGSYMTSTINISLEDGEHIKDYGLWSGTASIFNDYQMRVQLEKGTTATPYTPHQEQSLPLNLPVDNLFDINNGTNYNIDSGSISIIDNKVRATNLGIGTGHRGGMYLGGDELLGKTITLSAKWDDSHSDIGKINIITSNNSGENRTVLGALETNGGSLTLTLPNSYTTGTQFTIAFYTNHSSQSAGVYVDYFDIQVELGTKANSYTPYGTTPLEYCKIGTYSDEFFKNDPSDPNYDSSLELDRWYLKKNIEKLTYNGSNSEEWYLLANTNKFYINLNRNLSSYNKMYSNYYTFINKGQNSLLDGEFCGTGGLGTYLWFRNDNISNVNNFKTWLSTHNTDVYLPLETPQYILLSDTLQHQLDDIYNWVESYPGQTNISQINNDLPFIISARAMKDLSVIDKYPTENSEHLVESGGVYEVVNNINKKIADIDTIRHNSKNVVYGSETGANIYLDDAYDTNLVELSVDGVCEQETTKGYQLLNMPIKSGSSNGLTWVVNKDGSLTLNGTTTANTHIRKNGFRINASANEKVTLSATDLTNISNVGFKNDYTGGDILVVSPSFPSSTITLTSSDLTNANMFDIYILSGKTFNKQVVKIMLNKGDVAQPFEPYTGGQPSPSPDFPQEIKTIENSLKITSCNKNLLALPNKTIISNGVTSTIKNNELTIKGTCTQNWFKISENLNLHLKAGTYTLSRTTKDAYRYNLGVTLASGTNKTIYGSSEYNTTFTIDEDFIINTLVSDTNIVGTSFDFKDYVQLEQGSQATSFEEHLQSQITANLPENEFVGKLDDTYKDTLNVVYKDDGHYHLILNKMIGKVVLDGSEEGWNKSSITEVDRFSIGGITNMSTKTRMLISNYFKYNFSTEEGTIFNNLSYSIIINYAAYGTTTLEQFKNWLSTHNTEVYYALKTPYELDLGIVDITLFNGINHISNSEDADMSITYVKDINIVINKLINAVVSLGSNV